MSVVLPVGVVDQGVETLVDPLPEYHRRVSFIKCHHTACYHHVKRNLIDNIIVLLSFRNILIPEQTFYQVKTFSPLYLDEKLNCIKSLLSKVCPRLYS